jgi:CubicO group peptidase (beta-lactamase class C family)
MKRKMKNLILIFSIIVIFSVSGLAQPKITEKTENSLLLKTLSPTEQLDAAILKQVETNSPGIAVLIIKDGEVKYQKVRGMADLSTKTPIKSDSPFYIASLSKQFTAVAIMMLAERGKLSYDDKLAKYFPEFESFAGNITIRHILTHSSGLLDHLDIVKDSITGWTNDDVIKLLKRENRVLFQPGEKTSYSNSGYVLLSMIVEQVSGETFRKFLEENIFEPLEMKNTFVATRGDKIPHRVRGYSKSNEKWETADYDAFTTGGGGIYSTLEDLERWDRSFYTERLIKTDTLKLASRANKLNNNRPTQYGFGWLAEFAAKGSLANVWYVASFGDFKGFKGMHKRIPEKRFTVIILSNKGDFPWEILELAQNLYAS